MRSSSSSSASSASATTRASGALLAKPLTSIVRCFPNTSSSTSFQEQRDAKVSRNLTLHYKRTMYVLENSPANRSIASKKVRVFEDEDGQVTIRFQGKALQFRAFVKHGSVGVTPGDIVANKHLAGALPLIREQQQRREEERGAKLRTL